mgnify:CR=1 FL=1
MVPDPGCPACVCGPIDGVCSPRPNSILIRADYCGDGTAHTVNGTILDIFDYLSPPVQLQEEKWQMEARWTQTGALCLSQRRHPEIPFPGCVKSGDKSKTPTYVQPPKCQAYSTGDDRGLIVSTFQSGTK